MLEERLQEVVSIFIAIATGLFIAAVATPSWTTKRDYFWLAHGSDSSTVNVFMSISLSLLLVIIVLRVWHHVKVLTMPSSSLELRCERTMSNLRIGTLMCFIVFLPMVLTAILLSVRARPGTTSAFAYSFWLAVAGLCQVGNAAMLYCEVLRGLRVLPGASKAPRGSGDPSVLTATQLRTSVIKQRFLLEARNSMEEKKRRRSEVELEMQQMPISGNDPRFDDIEEDLVRRK